MKLACAQINCQNDMQANLAKGEALIKEAANHDVKMIAFPENAAFMPGSREELYKNAYDMASHPAVLFYQDLAKAHEMAVLIGSIAVTLEGSNKLANRSCYVDEKGELKAYYDKIHLFDVAVSGGELHNESKRFDGGNRIVTAQTPCGKMGMTICYDLRFPQLFRRLSQQNITFIAVPAAFTLKTGKAHWKTLLRARAIENSCYIIAPAQTGSHPAKRHTYGHSMIINPWGEVIAEAEKEEGIIIAQIEQEQVDNIRGQIPAWSVENLPNTIEEVHYEEAS